MTTDTDTFIKRIAPSSNTINGAINHEFIASCDVGTTTVRCIIYSNKAVFHATAEEKVELTCPKPGYAEIDPNDLWEKFVHVVRTAIKNSKLKSSQIKCLGLSTQRATFVLWDRSTGKPLYNFITWKDIRADALVKTWNKSWIMKALRFGSWILYQVLKNKRYLAASILQFHVMQVNVRLKWVLDNVAHVAAVQERGDLMFGTVDSWLIYKLTDGKLHATDYSNASGTAIFDPYLNTWSSFLMKVMGFPPEMFPEVRDTVGHWGDTDPKVFGAAIPITAVVSDQGASLFGGGGLKRGDVKITLGTGAFLNVNTGDKPHTSINGIYPVIGWKDAFGTTYMAEGSSVDNGTIVDWGKQMGFYKESSETSGIAYSVPHSNGVFFIPAFQGVQAPINDALATSGFIGVSASCKPAHFVRAMLESLAFRIVQIYNTMHQEARYDFTTLRADGGVSQNDFMLQMVATLTNKRIERPDNIESSSLGCCFLAGIGAGVWDSCLDVLPLIPTGRIFEPEPDKRPELLALMRRWEEAMERFTHWHKEDKHQSN